MTAASSAWTDIAVAITAIIAILLSGFSLYCARASLILARGQERRREPQLGAQFLRGDYTTDQATGARTYHLEISVNNLSDSDNAIARMELRISYRLGDGAEMTVRLQQAPIDEARQLNPPMRVAAHETVAGWCHFVVPSEIFVGNRIDQYIVEIADTHGLPVSIVPLILSERRP